MRLSQSGICRRRGPSDDLRRPTPAFDAMHPSRAGSTRNGEPWLPRRCRPPRSWGSLPDAGLSSRAAGGAVHPERARGRGPAADGALVRPCAARCPRTPRAGRAPRSAARGRAGARAASRRRSSRTSPRRCSAMPPIASRPGLGRPARGSRSTCVGRVVDAGHQRRDRGRRWGCPARLSSATASSRARGCGVCGSVARHAFSSSVGTERLALNSVPLGDLPQQRRGRAAAAATWSAPSRGCARRASPPRCPRISL